MKRTLFTRMLLAMLLALFAAGCASVQVSGPAKHVRSPAMAEAAQRATQDASLAGQARRDNTDAISRLLATLDDAALAREAAATPAEEPLYNFLGRAQIARGLPLPHPFASGDWRFDAGDRPAADRDGYRPPMKLALLLPLSGGQAGAAAAVRDGFLTGYYGEARRRPELRFYDTAAGAGTAYARAVAEGNDFVVGPLGRDEVDAVFADDTPQVPLLALNRGNRTPPPGSAAFSLSPEDEGISIAQYLIQRGAKHVLVYSGGEDAQRRSAGAAKAQLERRGVQVTEDIAAAQGVDALLLAAKAPQVRALLPRLALAGISATTRVATSQITSGTGKPADDMALDGIVFPTETWSARGVDGLPSQASAAARVDTAKGPAARLFAFGFDAWRVTAYLERLALSANAEIAGATGRLSLDGFGNLLRQPSWSRFSGGVAVPLGDDAR